MGGPPDHLAALYVLALAAIFVHPVHGQSADTDAVRELLRDIIDDGGFQTDLPFRSEAAPPTDQRRNLAPRNMPGGVRGVRGVLTAFAFVMLGAFVVVAIVGVILVLRGHSAGRAGGGRDQVTAAGRGRVVRAADVGPPDFLERVEELGRAGRYQDAVHLMLLGAIDYLSRTAQLACRDSHTSREVVRCYDADPPRRVALRHLVDTVEHSLFRGRAVTPQRYQQCRHHLDTLLAGGAR